MQTVNDIIVPSSSLSAGELTMACPVCNHSFGFHFGSGCAVHKDPADPYAGKCGCQEKPAQNQQWHRFEAITVSTGCDEWGSSYGNKVEIVHYRYDVDRETPKGVWLNLFSDFRRFVLKSARKRYACPTEQEALESLIARKKRQIRILSAQLENTKKMLSAAENHKL